MKQIKIIFYLLLTTGFMEAQNETMFTSEAVYKEQTDTILNSSNLVKRLPDPEFSMYPDLPKLLVTKAGTEVKTIETWENVRRKELLNIFRDSVYGRVPQPADYKFKFSVSGSKSIADGTAIKKMINFSIKGPNGTHKFQAPLYIPKRSTLVPVVVLINHKAAITGDSSKTDFFPLDNVILPRGYAVVVVNADNYLADDDDASIYRNGIINKFNLNGPYDWKTISAWSFGISRVIDYLVTDPAIDASKIITVGHSRGGKTSLWTAAQDTRVALVCLNNAGCTGDRLMRSSWELSEKITNINTGFPHWFADKYKDYNGKDFTLPFDFHQLVALVAPRFIAQGIASADDWADPDAQFEGLVFAQPAFALYGKTDTTWQVGDIPSKTEPTVKRNGNIQSHMRIGAHDLLIEDWNHYLDFADIKLLGKK